MGKRVNENSAYSKEAAKRTGQEDASPLPRTQGYVPLSAAARRTSTAQGQYFQRRLNSKPIYIYFYCLFL